MAPLKVAIVTSSVTRQGGGVAEVVRILAHAMGHLPEFDVEVVSLSHKGYEADLEALAGLKVRFHRFFGPRNFSFSPGLFWDVIRSDADLMHVHGLWGFHVLAVYLWHLITRRPYVVTPHGMMEPWIRARSPRLKAVVSRLYQDAFLREALAFQIFAEVERAVVKDMVPDARISVIANQVEPPPHTAEHPPWWTPQLEGRELFLFFGRVHIKKGIIELLDAWDALSAKDPSFANGAALVIAGWNDGVEALRARIASVAARHGNVIFAGPQFGDARWSSFDAARFFILPSKSEGQPMAVLEAWASGVPAIITEECNLAIGFESGAALKTGTNEAAIIVSLKSAYAMSEDEHAAMSRAGRGLVDEYFSRHVLQSAMAAFYLSAAQVKS